MHSCSLLLLWGTMVRTESSPFSLDGLESSCVAAMQEYHAPILFEEVPGAVLADFGC